MSSYTCDRESLIRFDLLLGNVLVCDDRREPGCGFRRYLGQECTVHDVLLATTAHNYGPAWEKET
jgi:hypothetical protein